MSDIILDIGQCPMIIESDILTLDCVLRLIMTDDTRVVSFLRVGKRRLEIFTKACVKFGLTTVDHTTPNCLILIDDELDFISASKIVKNSSNFIRTQWLSDSIKQNQLLSYQSYRLQAITSSSVKKTSELESKIEIPKERPPVKRERSISSSNSDTDDEPNSKKVFYWLNYLCLIRNFILLAEYQYSTCSTR